MEQIRCNTQSKFSILYHENVDIDGFRCRHEFSDLISKTGRRVYNRAHEWCCGHGAIGFQLLEDGLCQHLVLTDKFELATQDCSYTVAANGLYDKVSVYTSDRLDALPNFEKWDLFVANPPWRCKILPGPDLTDDLKRKMFDIDWQLHDHMWSCIARYLTDDADVYIYEDYRFSDEKVWEPWIKRAGLRIHNIVDNFGLVPTGYVMHIKT
jgi:hypothetical protein